MIAAALMLTVGAVVGLATPASAHNYLIASTPSVNGTLTSLPRTFEITTNDKLLNIGGTASGFAFRVVGPDRRYYDNGCVDVSGPSMTTKAKLGQSGQYTVQWQLVSADGHTVSDDYTFRWEAPAGYTAARGAKNPPSCASSTSGSSSTTTAGSNTDEGSSSASSDALWIGAGGVIIVAAVVAVLLLLRRKPDDTESEDMTTEHPTSGHSASGRPASSHPVSDGDESDDGRD